MLNNIFYGLVTPVSWTDVNTGGFSDYSDYFNNTNANTNWALGSHNLAVDPQFVSMHQITGTGASSSTNVLTDTGETLFGNITDNVDFLILCGRARSAVRSESEMCWFRIT